MNVNSASTLEYRNINDTSRSTTFSGAAAFALNADLTVKNVSSKAALGNGINLQRNLTGSGDMIVETYNNITSGAINYGLGRVFLNADNSNWIGDVVVAKGTVALGGGIVTNSMGTGAFVIGTALDSFGAGIQFFPGGIAGSTATYNNAITVRTGPGFRSIQGSDNDRNIALGGNITLEGSLNVDHKLNGFGTPRSMTLSGNISGDGGLDITRSGGATDTFVSLVSRKILFDG